MFIKPHILIFTNVKFLSIHIDFVKVANSYKSHINEWLFDNNKQT